MSAVESDYVEGALSDALEEEEYRVQDMLANPLAYAASRDPDTMYVDQALKAPDKKEFLKAMKKEVEAHTEMKHWELVPRSEPYLPVLRCSQPCGL